MIADTLACLLLILGVVFGLSQPLVARIGLSPCEKLVAGAALSLIVAWVVAWAIFISGASLTAYWMIPGLALAGAALGWRSVRRIAEDPGARDLIAGQVIVTSWCVLWLSFVRNHSGGGWTGDSLEHWERARYFLRNWPKEHLFIEIYSLPARPPLANLLTAAFLRMTRADYSHFQVVTTALCSLAYLPTALLAGRFAGRPASRITAVVLMVNPLFLQNATYPWTKLQAAFFVLAGFYFFLRARDPDANLQVCAALFALSLSAAAVTHYSAGPYIVVLGIAWMTGGQPGWSRSFARATAAASALGACVIAPWLVWSVAHFGWHGTFLSNSTTTMMQRTPGNPLVTMALNLRDTLLPPQVRGFEGTMLLQTSPWGMLRDQFFLVYQLNPLLALGCVGWLAALREAVRAARSAQPRERMFWVLCLAGVVAMSMAVYGDRDHYGTGHICLQSLVLCTLAFIASRWDTLGRGWRWALAAGWAVDFALGIALQFAVEDFALDRLLTPGRSLAEVSKTYTLVSQENLLEKFETHLSFFADNMQASHVVVLALLGAILCMAIARVAQAPAGSNGP